MKVLLAYNNRRTLSALYNKQDVRGRNNNDDHMSVKKALLKNNHDVKTLIVDKKILSNINKLKSCDIVFNLADEGFYENVPSQEPYFPAFLDANEIKYTGSGYLTLGISNNKALTKKLLLGNRIPTPKFQIMSNPMEKLDSELCFPFIVKPLCEDGSVGIRNDSVVRNKSQLNSKIKFVLSTYKQPALIEEYIEGREFNVAILGNEKPEILEISEIIFDLPKNFNKIVSYNAKWLSRSREYKGTTPKCPAAVSNKLRRKIIDVSLSVYKSLNLYDYGRIDLRVKENNVFVIEANPNPDISENGGLANIARSSSLQYDELIQKILNYAVERNRKN